MWLSADCNPPANRSEQLYYFPLDTLNHNSVLQFYLLWLMSLAFVFSYLHLGETGDHLCSISCSLSPNMSTKKWKKLWKYSLKIARSYQFIGEPINTAYLTKITFLKGLNCAFNYMSNFSKNSCHYFEQKINKQLKKWIFSSLFAI